MDFREYLGFSPEDIKESIMTEAPAEIEPKGILVDIEAVHTFPYATRNNTRYMEEALAQSVAGWTYPYNIPVITYHNDEDGEIVGRVLKARVGDSQRLSGTKALILTCDILDPDAQEKVKNGLFDTVSIGVRGDDVRCSICGQELNQGMCEHIRGEEYNGKTCYWDFYKVMPKELSYVIVPSDAYAKNIKVYDNTEEESGCTSCNPLNIVTLNSTEGENNAVSVKESMAENKIDETKVEETKVEGQESEVTETEVQETEVEETTAATEVEGQESLEELKAQIKTLTEAKEKAESDFANLASDLLAYKAEVRKELDAYKAGQEKINEALTSINDVKESLETFKTESEKTLNETIESTKESLEDKIQKLNLVNSTVENPVKTEENKTVEVKESVTGSLDFVKKYFPGK